MVSFNQVQPRPRSYPLDLGAHSYVDFLQRGLVGLALRITFLRLNSWTSSLPSSCANTRQTQGATHFTNGNPAAPFRDS
jgi:hypothetical protein